MANRYTDRTLLDFNYTQSDKVNLAEQQKIAAEQALASFGPYNFTYGRQADYDAALDAILNRKKFSYDLNGDALYQQYKDNYINQGKMAMMDTMGQASAMTGGYGNSYAATVGNQAYQASLQNLNNIVPQLYQLALESYNAEGDRLNNNLNVLGADRQLEENSYNNKYTADLTRLTSDRDYYSTNYNNERTFDYGNQRDTVDLNNQAYWDEYNANYQAEQDAIANQLARDQLNASINANNNAAKITELEAQLANSIGLDEIEYDETTGNIISIKGIPVTQQATPNISNFRTKKGDNFTVTVGENSYTVENEGKVSNQNTLDSIANGQTYGDITIAADGNAYLKHGNDYYRIGNTNVLFNWGISNKSGYSDLLLALQG